LPGKLGASISAEYLVTILSSLTDCGQWQSCNSFGKVAGSDAAKVWTLARAIDTDGSGKADINIKELTNLFGRTSRTINRWLKAGRKLGFFRTVRHITGDLVQVYYTSTVKLAVKLGVTDLGAIATAPVKVLRNLKRTSTEIQALETQRRSQYQQYRKKRSGKDLDVSKAIRRSSDYGTGVIHRTARYIYLAEDVQLIGGSQKRIAYEQSRSTSTVQRRLRLLSPLHKRQLAQTTRQHLKDYFYKSHCNQPLDRYFRIPDYPQLVFKAACCVYDLPEYELLKQKRLRKKVKKALQRAKNALDS